MLIFLAFLWAQPTFGESQPNNYGEKLLFHGWSPDNLYIAYTLHRVQRPRRPKLPPRVRIRHLTRRVYRGHLGGMGPKSGPGLKDFAKKRGYLVHALGVTELEKNLFRLETPGTPTFLRFVAKEKLSWILFDDEGKLAGGTFPKPYVRFQCDAYLSPDRGIVLLAMHVNTGWYQDVFLETARLRH